MIAESQLRGHPILFVGGDWYYKDTGERTEDDWPKRPCGHCGRRRTPEGHDGCLGTLPNAMNACCGHGSQEEAYIQLWDGSVLRGHLAIAAFEARGFFNE